MKKTAKKPEETRIFKAAADRIVMLPVSEVRPYERNPRKNADAVKYVKASIEKFGFKVPIIVDGNRVVICEQLNRKARLMELDPHYCDVIIARWEKFTGGRAERV